QSGDLRWVRDVDNHDGATLAVVLRKVDGFRLRFRENALHRLTHTAVSDCGIERFVRNLHLNQHSHLMVSFEKLTSYVVRPAGIEPRSSETARHGHACRAANPMVSMNATPQRIESFQRPFGTNACSSSVLSNRPIRPMGVLLGDCSGFNITGRPYPPNRGTAEIRWKRLRRNAASEDDRRHEHRRPDHPSRLPVHILEPERFAIVSRAKINRRPRGPSAMENAGARMTLSATPGNSATLSHAAALF